MQEALKELETLLDPYDWFYEVVAEARRYVVYVIYMDKSQNNIIPDFVQGRQVVIHFSTWAPGVKKEFINKPSLTLKPYDPFARVPLEIISKDDMEMFYATGTPHSDTKPSIIALTNELDLLEKEVGSNILQDVFYETHDGINAVTNLGSRYPEVQRRMKRLYNEYGFDTIYNELDG